MCPTHLPFPFVLTFGQDVLNEHRIYNQQRPPAEEIQPHEPVPFGPRPVVYLLDLVAHVLAPEDDGGHVAKGKCRPQLRVEDIYEIFIYKKWLKMWKSIKHIRPSSTNFFDYPSLHCFNMKDQKSQEKAKFLVFSILSFVKQCLIYRWGIYFLEAANTR